MLGTSSSESVLPRMMTKLENLGVKKSTVGLVIPTGYSFNLDGTAIYLTMAAVFIAQATNTPLDLTHQLTLLAVLLLTSKGAAGITGSGFIVLAATLSAVGHVPVAGIALILGIDRFMSEARALTNLVGKRRRHHRRWQVVQRGRRDSDAPGPRFRFPHPGCCCPGRPPRRQGTGGTPGGFARQLENRERSGCKFPERSHCSRPASG